ncbi:MAG: hypothetical protein ACRDOI_31930, partial [Trebonia sp.]
QSLSLNEDTRRKAIASMAEQVRTFDVHDWVAGQLALIAARGTPMPECPARKTGRGTRSPG